MIFEKVIRHLKPPREWKVPVIILLGIFVGLGLFLFRISNASSYLGDDPETCVNCHIMAPQYATWEHSSHREKTTCNDCHVPHSSFFAKYFFKAKDGLRHATIFTLRREPQVIFIREEGNSVVRANCIRCHEKLFAVNAVTGAVNSRQEIMQGRDCISCHRETPHGRINSISSVPWARVPLPQSIVPRWLKELTE